jgi:hypothetical protein
VRDALSSRQRPPCGTDRTLRRPLNRMRAQVSERRRQHEISARYSAKVSEHNALWNAWTTAADALYRARQMGEFGGPDLIAKREREVEDARRRLDGWELANRWTFHERGGPKEKEARAATLAARIAAGD